MEQHTPGPWTLRTETSLNSKRDGSDVTWLTITAPSDISGRRPVIGQKVLGSPTEEGLANARLIAAAPDLLGACKSALRALQDNLDPGPMDADAVKGLQAAISKATQ